MKNPLNWARQLLGWIPGAKHPDTHRTIFYNVWSQDRVRRVLPERCTICDFVVSSDVAVKELVMQCKNMNCDCHRAYGARAHKVCNACYDMWHALYNNPHMKNMGYFRQLDDADKKDKDDNNTKRRDRMGL